MLLLNGPQRFVFKKLNSLFPSWKLRFVNTAVKLSDIAFLRRAGGGVNFGINHTASPVALHHEGGLLVYLQVFLLENDRNKNDKNITKNITCVHECVHLCARTSRDTKCVTHA